MPFFLLLLMVSFFAGDTTPLPRYDGNSEPEETCQCVPLNMCADNDADDIGQGPLDIRMQNNICDTYFEVCCENLIRGLKPPQQQTKQPKACGYQNPIGPIARIMSDSYALFGELPWSVAILLRDVDNTEMSTYKCGGSLIHPQTIITAAHCVSGIESHYLTVRAGEWNTRFQDEPIPHQDRTVREILIHPHYQTASLKNDIALVFLVEPLALIENIGFICIPPQNFQLKDTTCIASGWGKDAYENGKFSSILKKVNLPLVPRQKCISSLRGTRLGIFFNLHRSFICAGGEQHKDTCKGDGGSPLVCPIPGTQNRFLQIGIVSWGIGCGEADTPGVYVNVPLYTDWIDKQLFARNLETSFYKY